jgi:hypothetical protein
MKHSTGKPTKADVERFEKLQALGCICCRLQVGMIATPVEIHHIVSGGRRKGHQFTLPLCIWHHRGIITWGALGPSLAHGSKPFHEHFGTQMELLAKVNALL